MHRRFKLPICILVACLHAAFAFAADPPAGTAPAQEPVSLASVQDGPSLQLSEASFDFGEMSESKSYVHDFKIKNAGTAELQIKKVTPG